MNQKMIAGVVVGALVIGGGSFFGGMKYAQMSRGARFTQGAGPNGQFPGGGVVGAGRTGNAARFTSGGGAFGTIISKDDSGITIELQGAPGATGSTQGTGSKIVLVNSSTQIQKSTSGTAEDLSTGQTVMIQGTQNTDGSITAQNIQIRPVSTGTKPQGQ